MRETIMLKVLRDFKTALRSFTAGQNVAEDEIDGAPAARWIALGFLAANSDEKQEPEPDPQTQDRT